MESEEQKKGGSSNVSKEKELSSMIYNGISVVNFMVPNSI